MCIVSPSSGDVVQARIFTPDSPHQPEVGELLESLRRPLQGDQGGRGAVVVPQHMSLLIDLQQRILLQTRLSSLWLKITNNLLEVKRNQRLIENVSPQQHYPLGTQYCSLLALTSGLSG